jgi:hypothetical protein
LTPSTEYLRYRSLPPTNPSAIDKKAASTSVDKKLVNPVDQKPINSVDQKSVRAVDQKSVSSPVRSTFKVSGQLHSWKSGDIKLLIKADEKEKNALNIKTSTPWYEPISSVFDEKSSKFEPTTINVGGEKFTKFGSLKNDQIPPYFIEKNPRFVEMPSSVIPTSSQLVKNVEENFKNVSKAKPEKPKQVF